MKSLITALSLATLLPFAFSAFANDKDSAARVRGFLEGRDREALAVVAEADKPKVVAELKRYAAENEGKGPYSRQAAKELVKLGDAETIEAQVQIFAKTKGLRNTRAASNLLALSKDAAVISRIADELFREEPAHESIVAGAFQYPRSILASGIIMSIGATSPQMSEQVRQSMKALEKLEPASRREVLRRWWTANKAAFAAENYAAVTPASL